MILNVLSRVSTRVSWVEKIRPKSGPGRPKKKSGRPRPVQKKSGRPRPVKKPSGRSRPAQKISGRPRPSPAGIAKIRPRPAPQLAYPASSGYPAHPAYPALSGSPGLIRRTRPHPAYPAPTGLPGQNGEKIFHQFSLVKNLLLVRNPFTSGQWFKKRCSWNAIILSFVGFLGSLISFLMVIFENLSPRQSYCLKIKIWF